MTLGLNGCGWVEFVYQLAPQYLSGSKDMATLRQT